MKTELSQERHEDIRFFSNLVLFMFLLIVGGSVLGLWIKFFWIGFVFAP